VIEYTTVQQVDLSLQVIILIYVVYNYERTLSLYHSVGKVHDYPFLLLCGAEVTTQYLLVPRVYVASDFLGTSG
jgi:hypothetical protein